MWIRTYTGRRFYYDYRNVFDIKDIAVALSRECRFQNHTDYPYSVAQHSVLVSLNCPDAPLEGVMHDAPEAYLGDIPTPLKRTLRERGVTFLDDLEARTLEEMSKQYGFRYPLPPSVKEIDRRMLATEVRDLMGGSWDTGVTPFAFKIEPWVPEYAEERFLKRFWELQCDKS